MTIRTAGRPRIKARRTRGMTGAAVPSIPALIAMATKKRVSKMECWEGDVNETHRRRT